MQPVLNQASSKPAQNRRTDQKEKDYPLFGFNKIKMSDLTVKVEGWQETDRNEGYLEYGSDCGDVFSVNFFDKEPNIGASLNDLPGIRSFYRDMLVANNMGLLECNVEAIDGAPAVYMLAKVPMDPRGFLFLASYTIPRQNHSYVLKYQAAETGMTGVRESVVMAMQGTPEIDESTNKILGWRSDPYDESLDYPVMRNVADLQKYDEMFPDHPLSRARKFMSQLPTVIRLSAKLKKTPVFEY